MDSVKQREGFVAFQSLQNLWWTTIIFSFHHYFDPKTQKKAKITVLSGFIKTWEGHGRFTNVL